MTPQEKALLQQNSSITQDISGGGQTTEFKSRFDPEIEALQKKYSVKPISPQTQPTAKTGFDIRNPLGSSLQMAASAAADVAGGFLNQAAGTAGNLATAFNPFGSEDLGQRAQALGRIAQPVVNATGQTIQKGAEALGNIGDAFNPFNQNQTPQNRLRNAALGLGKLQGLPAEAFWNIAQQSPLSAIMPKVSPSNQLGKFYQGVAGMAGQGMQNIAGGIGNTVQGLQAFVKGDELRNKLQELSAQMDKAKDRTQYNELNKEYQKTMQEFQATWDTAGRKTLPEGIFQAIQGVPATLASPLGGLLATAPKEVQQGLSDVISGVSNAVDTGFTKLGVDPNSTEAQTIKQGLLAALDVAGAVGAATKGGDALKALKEQGSKLYQQADEGLMKGAEMFAGKAANTFNNAVGKAFAGVKKATGKAGDFALNTTSNALWTTPAATMKKIYENGDDFLRAVDDPLAAQASALSKLQGSIDDAVTRSQVGGKGYEALRKSTQKATLPVDGILSKVDDFGLELVNGKLRPKGGDIMNSRLTADDIAYLNKNVIPELPVGKELTPAQYLNQRKKLDALAKYDMGIPARNDAVRSFVSDMRMTLNDSARSMFEGLAKLDDAASKNIKGLKELRAEFMRKDPVTKQYVLKRDIQPETIANLLSPRNKPRLAVLEKNAPGITRQLEILDLVKQVDRAANITTGAGLKRVGSSMAGGGLAGPVGALAGYIVSDPMMVAKMFARMGAKLGTKQSQVKGGVTAAGETVKGAKETVRSAATTAKGKGKLSTLTQESLNALGQNIQPQPPTQ